MMSEKEKQEAFKNRVMWTEFGNQFGWRLSGWSGGYSALFVRDDQYGSTVDISGAVREDINAAIRDAVKRERQKCVDAAIEIVNRGDG